MKKIFTILFVVTTVLIATLDIIGGYERHLEWGFVRRYLGSIVFGIAVSTIWVAIYYVCKLMFRKMKK